MRLQVVVPPGETGAPLSLDVSEGGPPDDLTPQSALATWRSGFSLSWATNRPHDWLRVLEGIEQLDAPAFEGPATTTTQSLLDGVGFVTATTFPRLGVTIFCLAGLEHEAIAVVIGEHKISSNQELCLSIVG